MHTDTLALTLIMAVLYLLAVRLVDFNEKEPLWAVLMLFVLGAGAAVALNLGVSTALLELELVPGVMLKELARFLAVGAGVAVLFSVGQSRGYREINGLMDGMVYGAACGLGFATGLAFAREILLPSGDLLGMATETLPSYGKIALIGLSDGVFGALSGIGFAAALDARKLVLRALLPFAGFLAAVGAHLAYDYIGRGNAFGDAAVLRKWIALLLPVAAVIVVTIIELSREKRAIAEELGVETETGAVSGDELLALQSFMKREAMYLSRLFRFDLGGWTALHSLHNRQVQLALTKRKAAREQDEERRSTTAGEVARLREAIFELKRSLGMALPAPKTDAEEGEG